MHSINNTELSSLEETRCQFNGGRCAIKLGIDVHQEFYVVVMQEGGANPKPPQRFQKEAFLQWAGRLKQKSGAEVYAVYEACGFGFSLQRNLSGLSIHCYVICPQKLDEQNRRVKTDGLDAKALCLKLDRFVQGNRAALAIVRVPSEAEERSRAIHRQREQLVGARKRLEAQGRSLMVNHGFEPVQNWWKPRPFAALEVPQWMRELLSNSQPIRQIASYTGLCPGEYSSGNTRLQSCVTKHGNPRLRAALVELAWRLVRFQPNYKPVLKWRAILAKGALATGAARKKAIVAVARQLAVDLWRIKTGRLSAEELGLIK